MTRWSVIYIRATDSGAFLKVRKFSDHTILLNLVKSWRMLKETYITICQMSFNAKQNSLHIKYVMEIISRLSGRSYDGIQFVSCLMFDVPTL